MQSESPNLAKKMYDYMQCGTQCWRTTEPFTGERTSGTVKPVSNRRQQKSTQMIIGASKEIDLNIKEWRKCTQENWWGTQKFLQKWQVSGHAVWSNCEGCDVVIFWSFGRKTLPKNNPESKQYLVHSLFTFSPLFCHK